MFSFTFNTHSVRRLVQQPIECERWTVFGSIAIRWSDTYSNHIFTYYNNKAVISFCVCARSTLLLNIVSAPLTWCLKKTLCNTSFTLWTHNSTQFVFHQPSSQRNKLDLWINFIFSLFKLKLRYWRLSCIYAVCTLSFFTAYSIVGVQQTPIHRKEIYPSLLFTLFIGVYYTLAVSLTITRIVVDVATATQWQ